MMEPLALSYRDLASNADRFAGKLVVVDGVLTVEGELAYLVLDPEGSKIRMTICDVGFVDRMLDNVPCYVGGQYLYQDTARLQGRLIIEGKNQIELRDVMRVQVSREGEIFRF